MVYSVMGGNRNRAKIRTLLKAARLQLAAAEAGRMDPSQKATLHQLSSKKNLTPHERNNLEILQTIAKAKDAAAAQKRQLAEKIKGYLWPKR